MFMALALCLTLLPAPVRAAEDTPESGAIVQQEQQEEISPAVSEQAGTNEEENGSEGDPQNTGTPDAGGAEDSKADAPESGEHTHCVCGKDSGTTVNGHTHNNSTAWTAADSLPGTAGSYYLTQPVSGSWAVPEGEVNLCLNGQTINGKITIGSGATLTLTDCIGSGRVQGEVTVNGGKFELYSGTICRSV